jgi:hypothetical protein
VSIAIVVKRADTRLLNNRCKMNANLAASVGLGQSAALAGKAVQAQKRVAVNAAIGRQVNRQTVFVLGRHQFEISNAEN